jgi:DNA polymerase-1
MGESLFKRKVERIKEKDTDVSNVDICKKCGLKKVGFVPTERNPGARILVIGEAPGKTEVEKGRGFVGQSGTLLRRALEECGAGIIDTANVVKCHPTDPRGNNRGPTAREQERCYNFLKKEMGGYELYILAGGVAISNVLSKDISPTLFSGHLFRENGRLLLPITHPAYLLRKHDEELKKVWTADIQWGIDMINGKIPFPEYELLDTDKKIGEFIDLVRKYREVTNDIETTGLDPRKDSLIVVGFRVAGKNFIYPVSKRLDWKKELNAMVEPIDTVILHNAMFDIKFLRAKGIDIRADIRDTQVLCYLVDDLRRKVSLKLKVLAKDWLGRRYKGIIRDMVEAPDEDMYRYNSEDLEYTEELHDFAWSRLPNDRLRKSYVMFLGNSEYPVMEMEAHGFKVDEEEFKKVKVEAEEKIKEIEDGLRDMFGEVKWSSKDQLEKVFRQLNIDTGVKTKTKKMQIRMENLEELAGTVTDKKAQFLIDSLIELRTLNKLYSTYIAGLGEKLDADWRIRASYGFTTTGTGRLSCNNPNVQSIPRASFIRKMFKVSPGYKLLAADFSQIELRIGAIVFGIQKMIEAFVKDIDIHRLTASLITGKSLDMVSKDERQQAKAVNFGFLYGASAWGFKVQAKVEYGIELSDAEAEQFRKRHFDAYGLEEGHAKIKSFVKENKYIESIFGRRRYLPEIDSGIDKIRGHAERQGLNTPVQSSASDVNLMTMWKLWAWKMQENIDMHFVATVHDSFLLEVKEELVPQVLDMIKTVTAEVEKDVREFVEGDIPKLKIEVKVGDHWA